MADPRYLHTYVVCIVSRIHVACNYDNMIYLVRIGMYLYFKTRHEFKLKFKNCYFNCFWHINNTKILTTYWRTRCHKVFDFENIFLFWPHLFQVHIHNTKLWTKSFNNVKQLKLVLIKLEASSKQMTIVTKSQEANFWKQTMSF